MTPGWVENLSDGPKIVHGPVFFYINLKFETCGAGIWEKKINLGPSNVRRTIGQRCYGHIDFITRAEIKSYDFSIWNLIKLSFQDSHDI